MSIWTIVVVISLSVYGLAVVFLLGRQYGKPRLHNERAGDNKDEHEADAHTPAPREKAKDVHPSPFVDWDYDCHPSASRRSRHADRAKPRFKEENRQP